MANTGTLYTFIEVDSKTNSVNTTALDELLRIIGDEPIRIGSKININGNVRLVNQIVIDVFKNELSEFNGNNIGEQNPYTVQCICYFK
jgi:hypothetical protein